MSSQLPARTVPDRSEPTHPGWWRVAAIVVIVLYLAISWAPFRFDPPRYVDNSLDPSAGAWSFAGPSLAVAPEPPWWIERAITTEAFVIELSVRTADADQSGPARILAISPEAEDGRDLREHNLVIGQEGQDLVVRLRRPGSNQLGQPALVAADALVPDRWHEVRLGVAGSVVLAVDDVVHVADEPIDGWAGSWDRDAVLSLGNTPSGDRPWLGVVRRAHVVVGETRVDLLREPSYEFPARFWVVPGRLLEDADRPWVRSVGVGIGHVTLGALLYLAVASLLPGRRPRRLLLVTLIVPLVVNAGKIVIATRHPSLATTLLQVAGLGFGYSAVMWGGSRGDARPARDLVEPPAS